MARTSPAPEPNAFTVDGRRVVVRAEIPLKHAPRLPSLIVSFGESKNGDDLVRVLVQVLESWEFDGDPTDARAYQDLDLYDEIMPIGEKAIRVLNGRLERGRQAITTADEANEIIVGERRFVVRKRIPLSMAPRLPSMMDRYGETADTTDLLKVLTLVADPVATDLVTPAAEARAYQGLDLLTEVLPLGERVISYLNQKLEFARTKN